MGTRGEEGGGDINKWRGIRRACRREKQDSEVLRPTHVWCCTSVWRIYVHRAARNGIRTERRKCTVLCVANHVRIYVYRRSDGLRWASERRRRHEGMARDEDRQCEEKLEKEIDDTDDTRVRHGSWMEMQAHV